MPDFEYFEGTKVIQHEDGSTTYIEFTHEPYTEPLTGKQQAAVYGVLLTCVVGAMSLPFIVERYEEWNRHRKEIRKIRREKKLAQAKAEPAK